MKNRLVQALPRFLEPRNGGGGAASIKTMTKNNRAGGDDQQQQQQQQHDEKSIFIRPPSTHSPASPSPPPPSLSKSSYSSPSSVLVRASPSSEETSTSTTTTKEEDSTQDTTTSTTIVDVTELSQRYRIALAVLACLQNSLLGGLVYGWASFNIVLTGSSEKGGVNLTLPQSTFIFSIASCVGMASTLLLGYALDQFGPRACSVLSHVTVGLGCQLFVASHSFTGYMLATCFLAFGGPGIQVSIVHLANLFPENQFTALSLLNGTISISFSVLAIFSWLWEKYEWLTYRQFFSFLAFLVLLSLIASVLYWPDQSFKAPRKKDSLNDVFDKNEPTPEDVYIEASTAHPHITEQPLDSFLRQDSSRRIERHDSFIVSKKAIESGILDMVSLKDAPFRQQFFSGSYMRGNIFFLVSCFLANFYVASITTELADANDFTIPEQNNLTRYFTFIMSGGVVASFVIGILMDQAGVEAATSLTILLGMLHALIQIFFPNNRPFMLFGFCVYVMFRQFLFPVSIALITARLGFKYFGLLNGICFLVSGVAQLFMVPLVKAVHGTCHLYNSMDPPLISDTCDHGHWLGLHIVEFALLGALLLVPYYDHRAKVQRKKQVQEIARVRSSWKILYGGLSSSPLFGSSYGSLGSFPSPSSSIRYASIRAGRDELDDVLEESEEGINF